jgi:NADH dehydrogenase
VKVLTRDREKHRHLLVLPELRLVNADVHDAGQLASQFMGVDVVINLVGILNERGRSGAGFRHAHTDLAGKVVSACRSAGVKRLLHQSSLGAHATDAPSHYLRSKGAAEELLRRECGTTLPHVIFRPCVIFGRGDSFITRFARLIRAIPMVFPLARATARLAPVFVGDVVEAYLRCLLDPRHDRSALELCGPEVFTLREIVEFTATTLGKRRLVVGLPDWIGRTQAFVMDFIPGKPFSSDNFRSLTVDSVCAQNGFAALGIEPHSMRGIVRQYLGETSTSGQRDAHRHRVSRAL